MSYNTGRALFDQRIWVVKSLNKYCRAVCRPTSSRLAFGLSHDTTRRAACCGA
jgi:hypothetical protein